MSCEVLVCDDDADLRETLVEALDACGFHATGAAHLGDAVRLARERRPDVVLLDLHLAGGTAYDFVRAKKTGRKIAGLTTETWGYSLASDLLPGFDFASSYSLFEGSTQTDTARFKPYLTSISANFSIGRDQNPLAAFAKLLGKANEAPPRPLGQRLPNDTTPPPPRAEDAQSAAA